MNLRRADVRSRRNLSARQKKDDPVTEVIVVTKTAIVPNTTPHSPPFAIPVPDPDSDDDGTNPALKPTATPSVKHSTSGLSTSSSQSTGSTSPTVAPSAKSGASATSSSPSETPTLSSDPAKSSGATTGSVFAGLLAIAAFAGLVVYAVRYYRKKSNKREAFNASHFRRSGLALHDSPKNENSNLPPAGLPLHRSISPMMAQTPTVPPASFPYAEQAQYGADPYGQYAASANQYNISSHGADGQITRRPSVDSSDVNISGATYGQHASYGSAPPYSPPLEPQNPFVNPEPTAIDTSTVSDARPDSGTYPDLAPSLSTVQNTPSPFVTPPGSPKPTTAQVVEVSPFLKRKSTPSSVSAHSTFPTVSEASMAEANYIEVQRGEAAVPHTASIIDPMNIQTVEAPNQLQTKRATASSPPRVNVGSSYTPDTGAAAIPLAVDIVPTALDVGVAITSSDIATPTPAVSIVPAPATGTAAAKVSASSKPKNPTEVRPPTVYDDVDAYGGF